MERVNLFISFLVLSVLLSSASSAEDETFARYYELTGLATDDVLNVRSGPSTEHRVVGKLSANTSVIEILERDPDVQWGRILWEGQDGWVFLEFVSPINPDTVPATNIPINLHCPSICWLKKIADSNYIQGAVHSNAVFNVV